MALSLTARRAAAAVRPAASISAFSTAAEAMPFVDVHTHVYLPRYMQMLRERSNVPRVQKFNGEDRLIILPGEDDNSTTAIGRPIGSEYYDEQRRIAFMDTHGIDVSVLSLANPWLDFLSASEAIPLASHLNDDLNDSCVASNGRFYGFGVLPMQDVDAACAEVRRIAKASHLKGVIMSTHGRGNWLDDQALLPVYQTLAEEGLIAFIHPHFGVGNSDFGDEYGHTLFLALGFTFETTTAVSRLVCSGMLDKVPDMQFLLAHSGGTLPFLAGRLDSCVAHDETIASKLAAKPSEYLTRNFYYDSLVYAPPALEASMAFVGTDRLMFGTDCPFFPAPGVSREPMSADSPLTPLDTTPWMSTTKNQDLLTGHVTDTRGSATAAAIAGGNAARVLGLQMPSR